MKDLEKFKHDFSINQNSITVMLLPCERDLKGLSKDASKVLKEALFCDAELARSFTFKEKTFLTFVYIALVAGSSYLAYKLYKKYRKDMKSKKNYSVLLSLLEVVLHLKKKHF